MSMLHVYRHLLRAARASVHFKRPAARSIRQLLRADVEAAMRISADTRDQELYAERTMGLLVLSALDRKQKSTKKDKQGEGAPLCCFKTSHASFLAKQVIRNLSSLAYHHLSPNTQMQPHSRRAGGSSSDTNIKPSIVNDALNTDFGMDADAVAHETPVALRLDMLMVQSKPVRGPVHVRPVYWDGQHPEKHLRAVADSQGAATRTMHELQERLVQLQEETDSLTQQYGHQHRHTLAVRDKLVKLRGVVKSMRRAEERRRALEAQQQCPKDMLQEVVQAASESESLWLGGPRWKKWQRGEFLPP